MRKSTRIVLLVAPLIVIAALCAAFGYWQSAKETYLEVDLKAMTEFPFDQVDGKLEDIPPQWRALDGRKVVLYGEMWQPYAESGTSLTGFRLLATRKHDEHLPPQAQWFVAATVFPGVDVHYIDGLAKISGTLHIAITHDEERRLSGVYHLDVDRLEEVTE